MIALPQVSQNWVSSFSVGGPDSGELVGEGSTFTSRISIGGFGSSLLIVFTEYFKRQILLNFWCFCHWQKAFHCKGWEKVLLPEAAFRRDLKTHKSRRAYLGVAEEAELLQIGLPTTLFAKSKVDEAIRRLMKLGPDCIEIVYEMPHFWPQDTNKDVLSQVRDVLKSYKMDASVHSCFFELNLGSSYSIVNELTISQVKKCVDICRFLDIGLLTVHPGYFPLVQMKELYEKARSRFVESLTECVKYANEEGVTLSIENIQSPYFFCHRLQDLVFLANSIDNLGITLDIGHAYVMMKERKVKNPEKEISKEIKSKLKGLLTHMHMHDNKGVRDNHLVPGDGNINFKPIVKALKEVGYERQVIVESWSPKMSAKVGKRALQAARKIIERY